MMKTWLMRLLCVILALALLPVYALGDGMQRTDVLYIVGAPADADAALISAWEAAGRSVTVASVSKTSETPLCGALKAVPADATDAQVEKAWTEKQLTKTLVDLIRSARPQVIAYQNSGAVGARLGVQLPGAISLAADFAYEVDNAAEKGVWVAADCHPADSEALTAVLADWHDMDDTLLRAACAAPYADAQHGDVRTIPYPETRGEEGFLSEGEFLWEDAENGLWAYASPTVAVEIVRYEQPEIPRIWYVSDVRFKPESEQFHSQTYINASFKGQMIYPETLAQSSRMIFAMNTDYYIYRKDNKCTGNIIRGGQVVYNQTKGMGFPNLDTMAFRDDGTASVYNTKEITSDELVAQGNVHDAMSFGPYLVRGGELRVFNGTNHDHNEPRSSIGMISAGHYVVVTVEGRFNKGVGPAGVSVNQLGQLLYANGANEAINLDGGNTAVLIFMGKKLNRTASKNGNGTTQPRNMSELFGVGSSELVYTDMVNAK